MSGVSRWVLVIVWPVAAYGWLRRCAVRGIDALLGRREPPARPPGKIRVVRRARIKKR